MTAFLLTQSAALLRILQAAVLLLLATALGSASVRGAEPRIVALHGLEGEEVRQQGFTLAAPAKVHIYARGGGQRPRGRLSGDTPLFAYGWLLNAATREVVWQMDGANTRRDWDYRIADQYLDLPAGSYEAYFANPSFGQSLMFAQWNRNIDRRERQPQGERRRRGFLAAFGMDDDSLLRRWREQVGNYGMEVYLASPGSPGSFAAPAPWDGIAVALRATGDQGHWQQAFRLQRAASVHLYAVGEGTDRRMHDYGWIQDLRTRKLVWEMTPEKAKFAGGSRKNRRQVETLDLPAGDYLAAFATDDSHSPADWNAAPPCDPGLYGLTLSLPKASDRAAFTLRELPDPDAVLAELVRVGDDEDLSRAFTLARAQSVRILALGEAGGEELADTAWIEDSTGRRVWEMTYFSTRPAGGATKNRLAEEVVALQKGTYTLRVQTDGSHSHGRWNAAPPREAERYGATVFAVK